MRRRVLAKPLALVAAPADTTAPTVPTNVTASSITASGFTLSWTASTDAVGVTGYDVQIDGTSYATPTGTSVAVTGRSPSTTYSVRVRARDAAGNFSALSTAVNVSTPAAAPVAAFTGTPVSGTVPLAVQFTSTSTGSPTSYAWTFGDGGTATTASPSHTYTTAGTYTVALTVTNTAGSNTQTRTSYVSATTTSAPQTLFTTQTPSGSGNDGQGVTLGTRFKADQAGTVTGIRFYGGAQRPTTLVGLLFNDVGSEIARATFGTIAAGWNTATFSTPKGIAADTFYRAAIFTTGAYSSNGPAWPITNLHLTGSSGCYAYNADAVFPDAIVTSNYCTDVVYAANSDAATPSGFPDATNTGPTITPVALPPNASGAGWVADSAGNNISVTAAGATISGYIIPGIINNPNVYGNLTVQNCKIKAIGENDWAMKLGPNSLLADCELGGLASGTDYSHAVAIYCGTGATVIRCNIHHFISSIRLEGGTLQDSFIHDLPMGDPVLNLTTGLYSSDDHSGGSMTTRGSGSVSRHNSFKGGNTACLFVQSDVTDNTAVVGSYLIENNLFQNDAKNGEVSSFGVDIETRAGNNGPFTVQNNTFTYGWQVSPINAPAGSTVTGNVYTDGNPA